MPIRAERPTPSAPRFRWERGECLALAKQSCTFCYGLGLRPGRHGHSAPCNCVFRAIFRACYARFQACVNKEKHLSRVSFDALGRGGGPSPRRAWGLKDEEYMADFCLDAKRVLTE